jgi:hypothetical protein
LHERTWGWLAGFYLAALAARESGNRSQATRNLGGDDGNVCDYLTGELLSSQPAQRFAVLLRTSLLQTLFGLEQDAEMVRESCTPRSAQEEAAGGHGSVTPCRD